MAGIERVDYDGRRGGLGDWEHRTATFTAAAAKTYPVGLVIALNSVTEKWVPYVAAGADGTGIPKSILTSEIVSAAPGDFPFRVMIKGGFAIDKMSIDAGGSITSAIIDSLQDYGILAGQVTATDGVEP